jgi:hypothetical protein
MELLDSVFYLLLGVGLSAAAGFRVFVPLLVLGLAGRIEQVPISENMLWMTTTPAVVVFAAATAFEVAAYYVPWLDNALDTLTTPLAVVAGVVATASVLTDVDPLIQWSLGLIAGGTAAGVVQIATVATRAASSLTTAGLGNPLISTVEAGAATGVSLAMVALPTFLAALLVLSLLVWAARALVRRGRVRAMEPVE